MFKEGIGEDSRFRGMHPLVNLIYYGFVIGISMFTMDPYFIGITFFGAAFYGILLRGKEALKTSLFFVVPILFFTTLVNTFFTHNGETVLFFIRNNRITEEALVFGIANAFMFSAVIIWFISFNVIMSADKLIYIFGKIAPVLGLTLSMIFRFIPLLRERFKEIRMGQQCMGRNSEGKLIQRVRQLCKEISILISWSLEASIETSDSMEARGYGLPHRTAFHLFKFSKTDKTLIGVISILGIIATVGCAMGRTTIQYYPVVVFGTWDLLKIVTFITFLTLIIIPIIYDFIGEKKWQRLMSKI